MPRRPPRLSVPIGIIALLIIFHAIGWSRPLERVVLSFGGWITMPLVRGSLGVSSWYRNVTTDLQKENADLRARVITLEADKARLQESLGEVAAQRAAQRIQDGTGLQSVVVRVIGKEVATGKELIVIDKGSASGVGPGDPVVTPNGFLIGTVTLSKEHVSHVLLLTDESSRVAAAITEHPSSIGVLEGGYGLVARLNLIPLESPLEVGNTVKTAAGASRIPPGIPIGKIDEIRNDPHTPFKSAVISTFESLLSSDHLVVIHP